MAHMTTILVNTIMASAIPFFSTNNFSVYESGMVNSLRLQCILQVEINNLGFSYNQRKDLWPMVKSLSNESEEQLIDSLIVHSYDADVGAKKVRHLNNTKLVDFISLNLKNTRDYLNAVNILIRLVFLKEILQKIIFKIIKLNVFNLEKQKFKNTFIIILFLYLQIFQVNFIFIVLLLINSN